MISQSLTNGRCCLSIEYCLICPIRAACLSTKRPSARHGHSRSGSPQRKFPDKKLDDIIIAVKAKFDRDVSSSTLCAWLKPETAAKIEQLANASGQSDTKRRRICDYPKLEHALFLWYRGTRREGQP
jgi:hypothetical protein